MQQDISILIIDDDPQICELLCDTFDDYGYKVNTAFNGQDALALLSQNPSIKLIFLDLILPDINGLVLLQQLKSLSSAPIIMLSGLNTESDVVVGLEMGADDYIAKPFYPRVVVARAKAAIRRIQPQHFTPNSLFSATVQQGFKFDNWLLDTENHKLFSPSQTEIVLTQGEYILLNALVCNARKVLSRQKLLELTHNESFEIFDRTIDVLIMRLRKKLEPNPKAPTYIKTIRGVGYLFDICCTPIK